MTLAVLEPPKYPGIKQPKIQVLADDWYRLLEDWTYEWRIEETKYRLRVAYGFEFDGASIPVLATPFFGGRWALGLGPPLVHDAFYRCGGDLRRAVFGIHPREQYVHLGYYAKHEHYIGGGWRDVGQPWPRSAVDRLFGRHMREAGVPKWRRRMAYRVVRIAGFGSWRG